MIGIVAGVGRPSAPTDARFHGRSDLPCG